MSSAKVEIILRNSVARENAVISAVSLYGWGEKGEFLKGCLLRGVSVVEKQIKELAELYEIDGADNAQLIVKAGEHYGPAADVLVAYLQARVSCYGNKPVNTQRESVQRVAVSKQPPAVASATATATAPEKLVETVEQPQQAPVEAPATKAPVTQMDDEEWKKRAGALAGF